MPTHQILYREYDVLPSDLEEGDEILCFVALGDLPHKQWRKVVHILPAPVQDGPTPSVMLVLAHPPKMRRAGLLFRRWVPVLGPEPFADSNGPVHIRRARRVEVPRP